jgi:branched-chain amino acid aminotransferase
MLKLDAHVGRFFRSMHAVRIPPPLSKEDLRGLLLETVRRAGLQDSYVCSIATRGRRTAARMDQWQPTLIVYAIPYLSILPPAVVKSGGKLRISSVRNVPIQCVDPKIKTYNRMHSYLAQLEAIDAGAHEAVLLDLDGFVSEARGANVFAVRRGRLYTPQENVLEGITRETVFEIAEREGLPAFQTRMPPYELYTADEVFLASTAGGVMPFVEVDGRVIGSGKPGEITMRLRQLYWQTHTDPRYCTPVYP